MSEFKCKQWVTERIQWIKMPAARPEDLNLIPWDPHGGKKKTHSHKLFFELYIYTHTLFHTHSLTHT